MLLCAQVGRIVAELLKATIGDMQVFRETPTFDVGTRPLVKEGLVALGDFFELAVGELVVFRMDAVTFCNASISEICSSGENGSLTCEVLNLGIGLCEVSCQLMNLPLSIREFFPQPR